MTREEAIKMAKADLKCMERDTSGQDEMCNSHKCDECSVKYERGNMREQKEWLRLAITALEQNPTTKNDLEVDWESYKDVDGNSLDDLILEVLQNYFDCGNTYGYKVADEIIGLLPSVTPQEPKWIPVTEGLPKKDGLYLVSVKNDHLRRYSKTCWYSNKNWFARQDVVAWMPLPQPYKAESEDK